MGSEMCIRDRYQHADFLTKALPEREFEFHRGIVMNLMRFLSWISVWFSDFLFFICFFGLFSYLYLSGLKELDSK